MFLQELELLLLLLAGVPLEQLPDCPQAMSSVGQCRSAGCVQPIARIFTGQCLQPHEHAHGFDAPDLRRRLGPLPGVRTDRRDLSQEGVRSSLHGRDFLPRDVLSRRAEPARFGLGVDGHLFEPIIEDPDQAGVPAHPQSATDVFRRS